MKSTEHTKKMAPSYGAVSIIACVIIHTLRRRGREGKIILSLPTLNTISSKRQKKSGRGQGSQLGEVIRKSSVNKGKVITLLSSCLLEDPEPAKVRDLPYSPGKAVQNPISKVAGPFFLSKSTLVP